VSDTHIIVSELQRIISDIHSTVVKNQEGLNGENQSVSVTLFYSSPISTHRCPDSS